jgi:UDP-glucose 4-epimerase
LVTGGAGFIGSNLVDALLVRDDEVTVVDNLVTGRRVNLEGALAAGAELLELDIRDAQALSEVAADRRPEAIFHLAAQIDVRKSLEDPAFDAAVNVGGTANVLEAAGAAGTGRVVFISTGGAIYGEGAGKALPLDESAEIAPMSAYGQSKYAAEGYLSLYQRLYGVSGMALRLGNVYGPRQDPLGEAGVVAIFCGKLRDGGRPTVFGDGSQTRDYIYVGDIVDAALAAAASDHVGAVNIGTGVEASVLDLIEVLRELGGDGEFEPEFAAARPGEVQRIALDAGLAREVLGWTAKTDLREGMRLTLDSIQ